MRAHASTSVKDIAALASSVGVTLPEEWSTQQLHTLKHEGPSEVLQELERLQEEASSEGIAEKLTYLRKREAQMQYPQYRAAGWPLGSGAVESGNKLVVEARLRGAGMHWERGRVNALLALRTTLCSDRWKEDWPHVQRQWHASRLLRFGLRSLQRREQAQERLLHLFLRFPLSVILSCFPAPPPPPPAAKGRTEGQRRWGQQSFSSRAIREGRYIKHSSSSTVSADGLAKS